MRTIIQFSYCIWFQWLDSSKVRLGPDTIWLGNIPFVLTLAMFSHALQIMWAMCYLCFETLRGGSGGDNCHKACVKSLNMSQLGRQRSDQMEATHGWGTGEWDVGQARHANDVNQNLSVSPIEADRSWTFQRLANHLGLCSVCYKVCIHQKHWQTWVLRGSFLDLSSSL